MSVKLPDTLPCDRCGAMPTPETSRPEGRLRDLHRLACACGQIPQHWSVSVAAAIRLWNRLMPSGMKE